MQKGESTEMQKGESTKMQKGESTKMQKGESTMIQCPVCQDEKDISFMAPSDGCHHKVCWECYGQAYKASAAILKCPMCRKDFTILKPKNTVRRRLDFSNESQYNYEDDVEFLSNIWSFNQRINEVLPRDIIQDIRNNLLIEEIQFSLTVPLSEREDLFLKNHCIKKIQKRWRKYNDEKKKTILYAMRLLNLSEIEKQMLRL